MFTSLLCQAGQEPLILDAKAEEGEDKGWKGINVKENKKEDATIKAQEMRLDLNVITPVVFVEQIRARRRLGHGGELG